MAISPKKICQKLSHLYYVCVNLDFPSLSIIFTFKQQCSDVHNSETMQGEMSLIGKKIHMNPHSRHTTAKFKMYIDPLQIFHGSCTKSNTLHLHISMKIP